MRQQEASKHHTEDCFGERGVVYQHEGHVDVTVKDLVLERGNSVLTPAVHDVTDEEPEPSDQMQSSRYISQGARCLVFSQDRADITIIVNDLCQRTSNVTQQSLAKLKRPVGYLQRERQWGQILSYGRVGEEVTTYSDSDWARCKDTRKSSKHAGVILLGSSMLKANTRKQKVIARKSAESELHAAALGAKESQGMVR